MQNQKTPPINLDDLPALTDKQQAYVDARILGDTQKDAQLKAYGRYDPVEVCRLEANPKIQAHLCAIRAIHISKTSLSLQDRIKDELEFAQRCENAGNYGAAGGARDRVNKLLGLYVDKLDMQVSSPESTLNEIATEFGQDIADLIAKRNAH